MKTATTTTSETILAELRKLVDTTTIPTDLFVELCRSAIFYAKHHPANVAAKLAVEECL